MRPMPHAAWYNWYANTLLMRHVDQLASPLGSLLVAAPRDLARHDLPQHDRGLPLAARFRLLREHAVLGEPSRAPCQERVLGRLHGLRPAARLVLAHRLAPADPHRELVRHLDLALRDREVDAIASPREADADRRVPSLEPEPRGRDARACDLDAEAGRHSVATLRSDVHHRSRRDQGLEPPRGTRESEPERAVDETPEYVPAAPREIVVGDRVKLRSFGSVGIVDQIKDGMAEVRVKSLRFREKLENLELVEATAPKPQPGKLEKLRRSAEAEVHLGAAEDKAQSELNVIGQTTDEAVDAVDKFLDEASLASLSKVRIIHGHGTGALRRAIGALLDGHPHVSRFLAAPPDQGGAGATLVELRQ